MTREEHIYQLEQYLRGHSICMCPSSSLYWQEHWEEVIKALEQEPRKDEVILTNKEYRELISNEYDHGYCKGYAEALEEQEPILDKIRAEITTCLKALDEIEKSGLKIYLPNEMSGRRLTYQQCLEFIDKAESEGK